MLYILFNLFLLSKFIFLLLLSMRLTYWRGVGVGGGRLLMSPETQAYIMIVYVGTLKIYVKKVNTESNVLSIVCHT